MGPPLQFSQVDQVLNQAHGLLEGPTWTGDGVAFSDVMLGGVWLIEEGQEVRQLLERRRGIGGIAALESGALAVSGRDISILADGELTTLYEDPSSKGFNDITADHDGNLLAGVLRYLPLKGEDPVPGELIRIAPDGSAEVLADDILWPNGIVSRPGGSVLISDYARGHVKLVRPDGHTEVFAELPEGSPDGLALDADGGLWVAGGPAGNLTRFEADGTVDRVVDVPARFVSSLCFSGPWLEEIHITTADNLVEPELGGTVLVTRTGTPGAALPQAFPAG